MVQKDDWSDLARFRPLPEIDADRMLDYRQRRLRQAMAEADVALTVLVSPVSLRYAAELRSFQLFQSQIPSAYLFMGQEAPPALHGAYETPPTITDLRPARPISFFDAGPELTDAARRNKQHATRNIRFQCEMPEREAEAAASVEKIVELIQHSDTTPDSRSDSSARNAHLREWTEPENQAGIENKVDSVRQPQ